MYANKITKSMQAAIDETDRRREIQDAYNKKHNITPETIKSSIKDVVGSIYEADYYTVAMAAEDDVDYISPKELPKKIKELHKEMETAAKKLDFEKAAELRDEVGRLEKKQVELG
jgi:excinuclease ABC subunit B